MSIFVFTKYGRTLFLAAAMVVGAVCVSYGQTRSAELVGQWTFVKGVSDVLDGKPEKLELFSDGSGVVDGMGVTWRTEGKRFITLSPIISGAADYNVSGNELVLTYDDGKSAVFVNKEYLNEYRKKEAEAAAEEAGRRAEAARQKEEAAKAAAEEAKKKEEAAKMEEARRIEKLSSYFTDSRNGLKYRTVKIGGKTWMAENLNYETGNSRCYEKNNSNCAKYGRLYNWSTAKKACPSGFHLPSKDEWNAMTDAAGGKDKAGKALRSATGWNGTGSGTDSYGFSALPGGARDLLDDTFAGIGQFGFYWAADGKKGDKALSIAIFGDYVTSEIDFITRPLGLGKHLNVSLRCIAD